MKQKLSIILGIVVVVVMGVIIFNQNKNKTSTLVAGESNRKCFAYYQEATKDAPYRVDEYIDIAIDGTKVSGVKHGTQNGPDMTNGYAGTLSGTIAENNLDLLYAYKVEGSKNTEKEIYKMTKRGLEKWRYPLLQEVGMLVPDLSKEYKVLKYDAVDCAVATLPTKYITSVGAWPPEVKFTEGKELICKEGGAPEAPNGITTKKVLSNSVPYCVTIASEGAAGSTYVTYTYATDMEGALAEIKFVLKATQCMNYSNPKQAECLAERSSFNPDTLAEKVMDASR
jgi:hypothetical protein